MLSSQKAGRPHAADRGRRSIMTSESKHASAKDRHAPGDGSIVAVIPYLTVLVCAVAGVYLAWRQGSAGGGQGAVVGGVALLAGALLRLALPARLVGLLGTRKRVTDVLTLAVLGTGLIIAGLVLPRALGTRQYQAVWFGAGARVFLHRGAAVS
jgi:hypothetical protein